MIAEAALPVDLDAELLEEIDQLNETAWWIGLGVGVGVGLILVAIAC